MTRRTPPACPTNDPKKRRSRNQSCRPVGQPDVLLEQADGNRFIMKVLGFDYIFDTRPGEQGESCCAERL